MRDRFLTAMGIAAALVAGLSLTAIPVAGQGQTSAPKAPAAAAKPAATAPAAAKPATVKKAWTPKRLPDGQPDIQGIWLAQGMGTEPKVGGPFDANSSAAKIEEKRRIAKETGGTAAGIGGRCDSIYWDEKPDLIGISKGVVDPPDGQLAPLLTPWGGEMKARVRAFQQLKDKPTGDQFNHLITAGDETCMPGTPYPFFNVLPYSANQFFQGPGYVLMVQEFSHLSRYIPLDGRPHLSSNIKQWIGDSRGHWDGHTLVVDTTNINGKSRFDGNPGGGIVESEDTHLVERFTFAEEGMILYEVTVTDPKTFTKPWKTAGVFTRPEPDYKLWEYACWEGNRDVWLQFGIAPPIPPANPTKK